MEPSQQNLTTEINPRSNFEHSQCLNMNHKKLHNSNSPATGFNCSTGGCQCDLCISQCSAKGGNLSLDGSPLSTSSSSDCTCSDNSSFETSVYSSSSCCASHQSLAIDAAPGASDLEEDGKKWKLIPLSLPNEKTGVNFAAIELQPAGFSDQEKDISEHFWEAKKINVDTEDGNLENIKIVSTWSISSDGNKNQQFDIDEDDQHLIINLEDEEHTLKPKSIPLEKCRTGINFDPRLNMGTKRQVAEIKPRTTSGKVQDHNFHDTNLLVQAGENPQGRDAFIDSSNAQSKLDKSAKVQRGTMTSGTALNQTNESISIGYGPKTTVVRSDSYIEDVQTIVDNVLKANLPVILLAGISGVDSSQENTKKETVCKNTQKIETPRNPHRIEAPLQTLRLPKRTSDAGTSMVGDDNRNKGTQTLSSEETLPKSKQFSVSNLDWDYKAHSAALSQIQEHDCKSREELKDAKILSMIKYMINHLPCYSWTALPGQLKIVRFVVASDVNEVIFPNNEPVLKADSTLSGLPKSNFCSCNFISQHAFAFQSQKVQQGELLVSTEGLTSDWFLQLVEKTKNSESPKSPDASPHKTKPLPLLGEVRYGNNSLAMIYHYVQEAKKTMIFVPAADLVVCFPTSAPKLRQLAFQNGPIQVAFNVRFRKATKEEARCLMRHKAATGRLDPNDENWRYLTSRSILVHWYDFKQAFLGETANTSIIKQEKEVNEENSCTPPPESKLQKQRSSPPSRNKGKKRKRSFTKVAKLKCPSAKPKVKTPSPKMCRTSTPVTLASAGDAKSNKGTGGKKRSPIIPFVRKQVPPLGKNSPLSTSSSMNESENQVCKGLWKLQQEILKLQDEQKKNKNKERVKKDRKKCSVPPVKPIECTEEEHARNAENLRLKQELENAVNSNPFTQSIEKLKMVKKLNAVLISENNDPPTQPPVGTPTGKLETNSIKSTTRNEEKKPILDQKKGSAEKEKIPVPIISAQSPAVEKIRTYLKKPPQVVRNPIYLDSSDGNTSQQNSRHSNALSLVSDDSIINFLNGQNDKENIKGAVQDSTNDKKLTVRSENLKTREEKKTKKPKKKKSHRGTDHDGNTTDESTPKPMKTYSDNPIEEAQRRILEIIKKQHREKMDNEKLKQNTVSGDSDRTENKDCIEPSTPESKEKTEKSESPEFSYRVFPRSEPGGQPKSGLVVIQTEIQSTLPYVVNNGFPYAALTHTRALFPECRCQTFGSVLKKSPALKRKVLMCSFEEAQMLHEEGQDSSLKVAQVTSGDWILRIDDVVALLSKLRAEVKEAHGKKTNGKCYGRGVRQ